MADDRRPALAADRQLPGLDMARLVGDCSRTFNPLARDFELQAQVEQLPGEFVRLSVVMPAGMTRAFVSLLESLAGFVRFVDTRSRTAAAALKAVDPFEVEQRRKYQEDYRAEVCTLFRGFLAAGSDRQDAVKRTCRALKAKKHPWATFDLVQETLRKEGLLRSSKPKTGSAPRAAR